MPETTANSETEYDGGVAHGALLANAAGTLLSGTEDQKAAMRLQLRKTLGDAAFVDICATIASFNAVVKIADGCGIPLEDYKEAATRDIRQQLAIDKLAGH